METQFSPRNEKSHKKGIAFLAFFRIRTGRGDSSRTRKGGPGAEWPGGSKRETRGEDKPREGRADGGRGIDGWEGGAMRGEAAPVDGKRRTNRRGEGGGMSKQHNAHQTTTTNHTTETAQETQPRTSHEKPTQGARRSTLDLCLKEPNEGDCFSSPDRAFQ